MVKKETKDKRLTRKQPGAFTNPVPLVDIRHLIEAAREQTASAVNSTLVMMYWQIGKRIRAEVLRN